MSRRENPEINAGSMADIAFLLLIFFLVTTTMVVDSGILRKIPKEQENDEKIILKDKNVLDVTINSNNQLLVENEIINIKNLKQIAIDFIDNGGGLDKDKNPCDWCNGKKDPTSSDHPSKAFIAIQSSRNTDYGTYITVLNSLTSANTFLRNKLSQKLYDKSYNQLLDMYKSTKKEKEKIDIIREKYPLLISDIENTN
ncbi:ExbD/TolR family protein [Polaribacter uvawellassae]|uniref:ExbD/TolR family protein n=1 Tax=Polaribacter uvawellassae TaxID=3133495 RepID=UPI003219748D